MNSEFMAGASGIWKSASLVKSRSHPSVSAFISGSLRLFGQLSQILDNLGWFPFVAAIKLR